MCFQTALRRKPEGCIYQIESFYIVTLSDLIFCSITYISEKGVYIINIFNNFRERYGIMLEKKTEIFNKPKERNDIMTLATYNMQHEKNMQEMEEYISSLKKMEKSKAVKEAKESLIRSGVLNKDGTIKKKICR